MAQRDIHATALALIDRRRRVQARVVLSGGQSLLHAGRVVQPLGLAVAVPRPLAPVHAVLPAARHRVASHPGVRHLVHVGHAVVHHGEPQQSTMKEVKSGKKNKNPKNSRSVKAKQPIARKRSKERWKKNQAMSKRGFHRLDLREVNPYAGVLSTPEQRFYRTKCPTRHHPAKLEGRAL